MSTDWRGLHGKWRRLADLTVVRFGKHLSQRRRFDRNDPTVPIFLVGFHRSGTNMFMRVCERAPELWLFNESHPRAFWNYRLRSHATIDRLIESCYAPVALFKPLCDSHHTDELLECFPTGKAIWIYRRFQDSANSCVKLWRDHSKETLRRIVEGRADQTGWRGERLSDELVELIKQHYRDDMSWEEGAALFWYVREQFYYQLKLDQHERVLLVRYENLVTNPTEEFTRVFDFLGRPFDPGYTRDVSQRSIRKNPFPEIAPGIQSLCDGLMERLDQELEQKNRLAA